MCKYRIHIYINPWIRNSHSKFNFFVHTNNKSDCDALRQLENRTGNWNGFLQSNLQLHKKNPSFPLITLIVQNHDASRVYETRSNTEAAKRRYIAALTIRLTHTSPGTIFIKTNPHTDTASAELHSHQLTGSELSYACVCEWMRGRVWRNFTFRFGNVARRPPFVDICGGARLVRSEIEIFKRSVVFGDTTRLEVGLTPSFRTQICETWHETTWHHCLNYLDTLQ